MKVTMRNYQPAAGAGLYKKQGTPLTESAENKTGNITQAGIGRNGTIGEEEQAVMSWDDIAGKEDENSNSISSLLEQAKESSNFKVSVSTPDDSVGQLATELSRAESRMDVVQVSSKAMRALANLKMSYVLSEGKDKEKIAQMIRRMERLTKKIHKKMRHLTNEEQLELQRKRAEKQQELERESEIRNELRRRKNKRRREEQNYASKEMDEDRKQALQDTISAMAGSMGSASSAELAAMAASTGNAAASAASSAAMAAGADAYAAAMDAPAADSGSVDVAV